MQDKIVCIYDNGDLHALIFAYVNHKIDLKMSLNSFTAVFFNQVQQYCDKFIFRAQFFSGTLF